MKKRNPIRERFAEGPFRGCLLAVVALLLSVGYGVYFPTFLKKELWTAHVGSIIVLGCLWRLALAPVRRFTLGHILFFVIGICLASVGWAELL